MSEPPEGVQMSNGRMVVHVASDWGPVGQLMGTGANSTAGTINEIISKQEKPYPLHAALVVSVCCAHGRLWSLRQLVLDERDTPEQGGSPEYCHRSEQDPEHRSCNHCRTSKCRLGCKSCVPAIGCLIQCDWRYSSRISYLSCSVQWRCSWELWEQRIRR